MRRYAISILAVLWLFSSAPVKAQDYIPTVVEGHTWVVEWKWTTMGTFVSTVETIYWLEGDTVINGNSYLKILEKYHNFPQQIFYRGAAREDILNKKIYTLEAGQTQEELVFDFNLQVGDALWPAHPSHPDPPAHITGIDTTFVYGMDRRRFSFSPCFEYNVPLSLSSCYLIEGVGASNFGLFRTLEYVYVRLLAFSETPITSTEEPEQLPEEITAFPNPGSGQVQFSIKNPQASAEYPYQVYNVQGSLLQSGVLSFANGRAGLDIGQVPGAYMVWLTNASTGQRFSHKIIVE